MPRRPLPKKVKKLRIGKDKDYRQQCTKISRTTGEQCRKTSPPGYEVCGSHGAGYPSLGRPGGYQDPTQIDKLVKNVMTSRRAKYLPDSLAERVNDAVNDPELSALTEDLALAELRLTQLLQRLSNGDGSDRWDNVKAATQTVSIHVNDGDMAKAAIAIKDLNAILEEEDNDRGLWREIFAVEEMRRRLSESHSNQQVRMGQMIAASEVFALLDSLLDVIKEELRLAYPEIYARISYQFAVRTGAAGPGIIDARSREVQHEGSPRMDQKELLDPGTQRTLGDGGSPGTLPQANPDD